MARQRDFKAEYAARKARAQASTGKTYSKLRYEAEKRSAKAQGFDTPRKAKAAGRKLSASTKRATPQAPAKVNVGRAQTIWRLDSPYDLGVMRAGTRPLPGAEPVIVAADLMGRSGPVRVFASLTMDDIRTMSHRKILDAISDEAETSYGGNWGAQEPSNVQATTRQVGAS